MLSPLDLRLYELFGSTEPHLHNVFTVAKERKIFILIQTEDFKNYYIAFGGENIPYREYPYNPSLHLLSQSDDTKSQIIDLFSQP